MITLLGAGQPSMGSIPILSGRSDMAVVLSLSKLDKNYGGNLLTVRRSSDNAEQTFGFSGNSLDTAALLSFVGAGNGYVKQWYDQSGNGRHVQQTTSGYQPIIVDSGNLVTGLNGKPSMFFSKASGCFLKTASTFDTPVSGSVFFAAKHIDIGYGDLYLFGFYNAVNLSHKSAGTRMQWDLYNSTGGVAVGFLYNDLNSSAVWERSRWNNSDKSYVEKFKRSSDTLTSSGTYPGNRTAEVGHLQIGGMSAYGCGDGIHEMIILNADCGPTDFAAIETDIQTRYAI